MSTGITGPNWQAAMRAGRENIRVLERQARDAMVTAHGLGRLGSSSATESVADLCTEHFRAAARAVASTYQRLKGRASMTRESELREALAPLAAQTLRTFDDNDGTGSIFRKPIERRQGLVLDLQRIIDDACSDMAVGLFLSIEVGAAALSTDPSPERLLEKEVKIALLQIFATGGRSQNRINVLGRPHQPGPLESRLGFQLEGSERAQAARWLGELISDGLLEPTYTDAVAPEDWIIITDHGLDSLSRDAADEIDSALSKISPHLVEMRSGARSAVISRAPDSQRQAALSMRELLDQVLHALAGDDEMRAGGHVGDITRKARVRYALKRKGRPASDNDVDLIEGWAGIVTTLSNKLSGEVHGRAVAREAGQLMRAVEMALETLLL